MMKKSVVFYLLFLNLLYNSNGFNVDTVNIDMYQGKSGSQFGYSSVLHTNTAGSWVIVGAPKDNMTSASFLVNPGNVYKCQLLKSPKTCEAFVIRTLEESKPASIARYEEDNQFLGGSIVRTKSKITVCAQKWKNMTLALQYNRDNPVGRCHDISHDLQSVVTNKKIIYSSESYRYALFGTAAMPTDIDDQIIIGGPGMVGSRGGFILYNAATSTNFYETYEVDINLDLSSSLLDDAVFGYSVNSGRFGPISNCINIPVVIGIPHFANILDGHIGSVAILCATSGTSLVTLKQVFGNNIGSGFGMVVTVADVNGDGKKDLLVGAPLQRVVVYDEGAVFVYYGTGDANYFQGAVQNLYGAKQSEGRFGSAIANVGDLNKDGFVDIAIGAPYEDDGYGAVYIFNGKSNLMNSVHSQRISSQTLFTGIKSFGSHISFSLDVDNNQYSDFTVGAYQSDATFIMRTSPVISVTARLGVTPSPIPLSSNGLQCASDQNSNPCVVVSVCFTYLTSTPGPPSVKLSYTLIADTLMTSKGKARRVDFYDATTNYKEQYNSNPVEVSRGLETCDSVYARTISTSRDFFTEIETTLNFQGEFRMTEQSTVGTIMPVLNIDNPKVLQGGADFQTGCLGICTPDLQVKINKETTSIIFGTTTEFSVTVSVTNTGEPAFGVRTVINIDTNNARFLSATTLSDKGSVPITCAEGKNNNNKTVVFCDHASALFQKQFGIFRLRYNVSVAALSYNISKYEDLLTFVKLTASSTAAGNEKNAADNTDTVTQDVTFISSVDISGVSSPEQVSVSEEKNKVREFKHAYAIYNSGPSPLFKGKLYFLIPAVQQNAVIIVPARTYTVKTKDSKSNCSVVFVPGILIGSASLQMTPLTSNDGYVPRSAECESVTDSKCIVIQCMVDILQPTEHTLLDINFGVAEASLDIDKTPEFRFYTTSVIYPDTNNLPSSLQSNTTARTVSFIYPKTLDTTSESINIWVIVGSVIGGVVLFIALGVLLWKCGFFKRDKKEQIEKWKRQSNFNERRRTQRLSRIKSSVPKDDTIALNTEH